MLSERGNRFWLAAIAMVLFTVLGVSRAAALVRPSVSAGYHHVVGLRSDGTVVAAGENVVGQSDVSTWTEIVFLVAGEQNTIGLKADGSVLVAGANDYGQHGASSWTEITTATAGPWHVVGVKSDGTVVAVGKNDFGQSNVSTWTDIVAVDTGDDHTVGLRSDGTVVASGRNHYGQCNVSAWTDIVAIAADYWHTVGLKSDGTVVATGWNTWGQCNVSGWSGIVGIAAGDVSTVGLKSNGTVVTVGDGGPRSAVTTWTGIVGIAAEYWHTVGLKSDGTVVSSGWNTWGQCNVSSWLLATPIAEIDLVSPNPVLAGDAVCFFGHEADPMVSEVGYSWRSSIDGTLSTDASFFTSALSAGAHTIYFRAQGSNGNWSSEATTTLVVNSVTPDEVTAIIDLAAPSTVIDGGTVYFAGHAIDSQMAAISDYRWSSDRDGILSTGASFSTDHLSVGTHIISLMSQCADGTWSPETTTTVVVSPKAATSLATTSNVGVVSYGGFVILSGSLASGDSSLALQPVLLEASSNGTTFTATGAVASTDANGQYQFIVNPLYLTYYRARFNGDNRHAASASASLAVNVRPYVSRPIAPTTMYLNKSRTVYGYLKPLHDSGTYPVRVFRERYYNGRYRAYGSAVPAKASDYNGYTKYSVSMKFPYRGKWRIRAIAPADTDHAASAYTGYDYVNVK